MAEIRRWVHLGVYNWSPLLFSHPGQPGNSLYPHLLKSAEVYSLGKLNQWGLKHGTMNMGTDISECLIEHGIGLSYFWAPGLECHNIHFPLHSYYQECHLGAGGDLVSVSTSWFMTVLEQCLINLRVPILISTLTSCLRGLNKWKGILLLHI